MCCRTGTKGVFCGGEINTAAIYTFYLLDTARLYMAIGWQLTNRKEEASEEKE